MKWILLFFIPTLVFSAESEPEPVRSPEEIELQLQSSEEQLTKALEMFSPWYTGPLITPSPSMVPQNVLVVQPYVFVNDNYAAFNAQRHSVSTPSKVNMNPLVVLETGITRNMDVLFLLQGNVNWQDGHSAGGFGDLVISPGFLIFKQQPYIPQAKIFVQLTFPTGKYQDLNPHGQGLDAVGGGSVRTQLGVIFGKLFFWNTPHPFNTRLAITYAIFSPVTVHNFNAYGGGFGTSGIVYPGGTFSTDLGLELSLTQRWVFALDIVYTNSGTTRFFGTSGKTLSGLPATVGNPSTDNLSFAPAFEYNWSDSLGLIAGVQFSVYGRNSTNFVSGILSLVYVYN